MGIGWTRTTPGCRFAAGIVDHAAVGGPIEPKGRTMRKLTTTMLALAAVCLVMPASGLAGLPKPLGGVKLGIATSIVGSFGFR